MFTGRTRCNTRRLSTIPSNVGLTSQTFQTVTVLGQRLVRTRVVIRQIGNRLQLSFGASERRQVYLSGNRARHRVSNRSIHRVYTGRSVSQSASRTVTRIVRQALILLRMYKTRAVTSGRIMTLGRFNRRIEHNVNQMNIVSVHRRVRIDVGVLRRNSRRVAFTLP